MKIEKVFKQAEKYKSKGNFNEAIALYEQAIKHNPNFHWYYYYLGEILTEIGQLEQAINNYYKVIQINPDFAGAHHSLGNALIENGRLDESIILQTGFLFVLRKFSRCSKYQKILAASS